MSRLRVPVRCCCNPSVVLGTLVIDAERLRNGERISFCPRRPFALTFPPPEPRASSAERVDLEIGRAVNYANYAEELALKSNETPLDMLRRVPGFIEIDRVIEIGSMRPEPCETEPSRDVEFCNPLHRKANAMR